MKVGLRNDATGEIKMVTVGLDWPLLLFSWVFGMPLFFRKLHKIGLIFLVLSILGLCWGYLIYYIQPQLQDLVVRYVHEAITGREIETLTDLHSRVSVVLVLFANLIPLTLCWLSAWIGCKGGEITGRRYLDRGWTFADPDGDGAKRARTQWGLKPVGS